MLSYLHILQGGGRKSVQRNGDPGDGSGPAGGAGVNVPVSGL